jgi:hypothetical protein
MFSSIAHNNRLHSFLFDVNHIGCKVVLLYNQLKVIDYTPMGLEFIIQIDI